MKYAIIYSNQKHTEETWDSQEAALRAAKFWSRKGVPVVAILKIKVK